MSSAGLRRRAIFFSELETSLEASFHVVQNNFVSVALKEDNSSVNDVLASRAPVNVFARVFGENSLELFEERHNRYRAFEKFADCFCVEEFGFGIFVNDVGFFLRDNAEFALSLRERSLYIKPFLDPRAVAESSRISSVLNKNP